MKESKKRREGERRQRLPKLQLPKRVQKVLSLLLRKRKQHLKKISRSMNLKKRLLSSLILFKSPKSKR
jgi:hypothetical protein